MLDKLKLAVRAAYLAGKASIWTALALALPYADDIVQAVDAYMPAVAVYLPANVYKGMGALIVFVKIALQVRALVQRIRARAPAAAAGA